jgi:HAMP domain-containing protein
VLAIISGIVLLFITGWLAYGIDLLLNLYNSKCGTLHSVINPLVNQQAMMAVHAMKTILAYELIWLIFLACLLLGGIVALIIYGVMLYRIGK